MAGNIDRFKADLSRLIERGDLLLAAMVIECYPKHKESLSKERLAEIPKFKNSYQAWYSEAQVCIAQLLPLRLADFTRVYAPDKSRKDISAINYTITDFLSGVRATRNRGSMMEVEIAGPEAAIPVFTQQLEIVKACKQRFESSLFDIRALVQADLYDNELDAANGLNKTGFGRAGGAIAGVALEGHLQEVFHRHQLKLPAKAMLGGLLEELKKADVIDTPTWRFLQHLADLRNLCDHKMGREPTKDEISELIDGVQKAIKTIF
jgi:hypothetical protein